MAEHGDNVSEGMWSGMQKRGFSRRQAFGLFGGLGAAAMLASCSGSPSGTASSSGPTSGGVPRRGGALRVGYLDAGDTLDPHFSGSNTSFDVHMHVYDNLTRLGRDLTAQPSLATKWRSENNAQDWVFTLREGVKYQHGREFTADDVVATFERGLDPAAGSKVRSWSGPVKSVTKVSNYEVRFTMEMPFADLPVQLAGPTLQMLPADRLDTIADDPVGTGPFTLADYQPGSGARLERYDGYWDADRIYLESVQTSALKQGVTQQAALQGGQVDLVNRIAKQTFDQLQGVKGIDGLVAEANAWNLIVMQTDMAPFDKVQARQAMRWLLDREGMVKLIAEGQGSVGNDIPFGPVDPYDLKMPYQYKQDLKKFKELLSQAGVSDLDLTVYCSSERPPANDVALHIQEAARAAGLEFKVRDLPFAQLGAEVYRKQPLYIAGVAANLPTVFDSVYKIWHSKGAFNLSNFKDPNSDRLIEEAMSETDPQLQKQKVQAAMEYIREHSGMMVAMFMNTFGAKSSNVRDFVTPVMGFMDWRGVWMA